MGTEEKMDKFLDIVASLHICNNPEFEEGEPKMNEIENEIEKMIGAEKSSNINDMIFSYCIRLKEYSVLQGIKLAIKIMDGTYIPVM